ncbi:MAG: GYDIA family GHMP kinase [Saprospiraceae bacterium]
MNHSTTPALFATRAQGKLLLTGEYFVLDGALALALPVRYGQALRVEAASQDLHWRSLDDNGSVWLEASFRLPKLEILQATDSQIAGMLGRILSACQIQNPDFLADQPGILITTRTDFPRTWGLGTSSTLIAAVALWAKVDPYPVLFSTFGGSGYDLACAYAQGPIFYQLKDGVPSLQPANFRPAFSDQLYFIYLEKKQDSRAGIAHYRAQAAGNRPVIEKISGLTQALFKAATLPEFESLLLEHEHLVSEALGLPRAKEVFFQDYWGEIKSLGAWGGDFVLATSRRSMAETRNYFNEKGCRVFIPYRDMTVNPAHPSF